MAIRQQLDREGPLSRFQVVIPDDVSGQIRGHGCELISCTWIYQREQFNAGRRCRTSHLVHRNGWESICRNRSRGENMIGIEGLGPILELHHSAHVINRTGTYSGDEKGYGTPCIGGWLGPGGAAVIGVWTKLHLYRCSLRRGNRIRGHERIGRRRDSSRRDLVRQEQGNRDGT